jgi:hypothetical protein
MRAVVVGLSFEFLLSHHEVIILQLAMAMAMAIDTYM